jgi:transcription elongation factor Elf1
MLSVGLADVHIQITLNCRECGHQWDVEDYDSLSVDAAVWQAIVDEYCPRCDGEDT